MELHCSKVNASWSVRKNIWKVFYLVENKTKFDQIHNGESDSYIRQSQLWDQIICQTKTANIFFWNWLVILMPCNSLTNFEFEEEEFCCNLAKRHPYQRWSWERKIDSIRWCYKNQIGFLEIRAIWPCLSTIFILRLETLHLTLLKLFEQKNFLSNCSKQLVTPVNLTRKKFHESFNFQDWERVPKAKKLPFIEVISAIV